MFFGSIACGWPPAMASAAITPSWLALCASHGGAVTSPIAQRPGTLVRHMGSVSIWPLVGLDTQRLQPDIFGIGDDADGDDAVAEFGFDDLAVLALDLGGDAGGAGLQRLRPLPRSGSSCPAFSAPFQGRWRHRHLQQARCGPSFRQRLLPRPYRYRSWQIRCRSRRYRSRAAFFGISAGTIAWR